MNSMVFFCLLVCVVSTLACDSSTYPSSSSVYVSQTAVSPGNGSECSPYPSLATAIAVIANSGGSVLLLAPATVLTLSTVTVSSSVTITGTNHVIELDGTLSIASGASLSISGVNISQGGTLTQTGFQIAGNLSLTNCGATGFNLPVFTLTGGLQITGGSYSSNTLCVIEATGLTVSVVLTRVTFTNNSGPNASVLDYVVSTLETTAPLPRLSFDALTVSQISQVAVFNVKFVLTTAPAGFGLIKSTGNSILSPGTVFALNLVNIEVQISNASVQSAKNGVLVSSTNAPVTVSGCSFTGITGTAVSVISSSSLVSVSSLTCTNCVQAVSINSPTSTCSLSGLTMANCSGATATLLCSCLQMTSAHLSFVGNVGDAINFETITSGMNQEVSIVNSTTSNTLVTLTDSTGLDRMTVRNSYSGVTILNILGALTTMITELIIQNCTSATYIVELTGSAMYVMNDSRVMDSYSEMVTFQLGTLSQLNTTYNNLTLDGVASGIAIWQIIGSNRGVINSSKFSFQNMSTSILLTSNYKSIFTDIEMTGVFKVFVDSSPTFPSYFTNLNIHDVLCQGLFMGNTFTMYVTNSTFSNITVVNALLTIQSSMTMVFTSSTFLQFQGRLFIMSQSSLVMTDVLFVNCSSFGSDVLMSATQSTLSFTRVQVLNFTGETSGALFSLLRNSAMFISQTQFLNLTELSVQSLVYASQSNFSLQNSEVAWYNSSFIGGSLAVIEIDQCNVSDGGMDTSLGIDGGFIVAANCPSLVITNSNFSRIKANNGGVASATYSNPAFFIPYNSYQCYLVSINSTFDSCRAYKAGGVFYLSDASAWVSNSTFSNNRASNGGGLQLLCDYFNTDFLCNYTLSNVSFISNAATLAGGGYSYQIVKPVTKDIIDDQHNTAQYGPLAAGYPLFLRRTDDPGKVVQGESGSTLTTNLTLGLFDLQGQLVNTENAFPAVVWTNSSSTTLIGATKTFPAKGLYSFTNFIVLDKPGASVTLLFQSEALDYTDQDPNINMVPQTLPLFADMRLCVVGEIEVAAQCLSCPIGSFSFQVTDSSCTSCISGMQCEGGANVTIDPGYWRPNNLSAAVFKCLFPTNCLGGADSSCDVGYEGRMCTVCQTDYTRLGKFQCSPCGSQTAVYVRGVGVALAFVALLSYIVYGALSSAEKAKSPIGPLTRILLNYIQTFSLVVNFNLDWPYQILTFTGGVSLVGSGASNAFSTTCLSIDFGTRDIYLKLMMMAILPVVLSLLGLVFWGLVALQKRSLRFLKDQFFCTVIVVLLAMHPNVLSAALDMIACETMENGTSWLIADATQECWQGDHEFYTISTALPAFLIWVVAAPLLMLIGFIRSRKNKEEKAVKIKYSYLSTGYRSDRFYWEFVILGRKTCMLALQNTLASSAILVQVFSTLMLLWFFYKIHLKMLPFNLKKLNAAEAIGILSVIVDTISGLLLTYDKSNSVTWEVFIVVLYMISTGVFFIFWIVSILQTFRERLSSRYPAIAKLCSKFSSVLVASSLYSRTSMASDVQSREPRRLPITN